MYIRLYEKSELIKYHVKNTSVKYPGDFVLSQKHFDFFVEKSVEYDFGIVISVKNNLYNNLYTVLWSF